MKTNKKKLTNKDFENRDNILMMELQEVKRYLNTLGATLSSLIRMDDKEEALKEYMSKQSKETKNV